MAKTKTAEAPTDPRAQVQVTLPSGATFRVYEQEVDYFSERSASYLRDFEFTNTSDLADLDRILMAEVLMWRYSAWIAARVDYEGDEVNEALLTRMWSDLSRECRQVKSALGIEKVARDKAKGEDSVSAYLQRLRQRANEFRIHRETQLDKALELTNELIALVTLHNNCTDDERIEQKCRRDDVWEWIERKFIPEFQAVDEYFRNRPDGQRYWIREL